MHTFKGQSCGIEFVGQAYVNGTQFGLTAQLSRDGKPFDTVMDGCSVAGCGPVPLRDMAVMMITMRLEEEIAIAKQGAHPAKRQLLGHECDNPACCKG